MIVWLIVWLIDSVPDPDLEIGVGWGGGGGGEAGEGRSSRPLDKAGPGLQKTAGASPGPSPGPATVIDWSWLVGWLVE